MKKIVTGIIIMLVGVFLLLNKMDYFLPGVYSLIISWQTLLIAIGIILLFDKQHDRKTAGLVLIVIGALFLLSKISPINMRGFIVPAIVIAVGVGFIIKAATRKNGTNEWETWKNEHPEWDKQFKDFGKGIEGIWKNMTTGNGDFAHKEYVFSNSKEKWTQGKLKNVFVEATFSSVELDFTQAELDDDVKVAACIKVKSVFSTVTLYVPEDWNIMVQKSGAFGGFTDNRSNRVLQVSRDKLVILDVETVFGGGEIRCYE